MFIIIFLLLGAVVHLIWDFKFSRASKAINQLKLIEPRIYDTLYGKSVLPPSTLIGGVIVRGLYRDIKSKQLKDEILAIDENKYKHILLPRVLYIGYIFLCLFLRTVHGG